ncbi:MAG: hypothetical protein QOE01_2578 [Actinomycetota bacterium]|nr:hypothetical protein [Actinomycetota bacterium]
MGVPPPGLVDGGDGSEVVSCVAGVDGAHESFLDDSDERRLQALRLFGEAEVFERELHREAWGVVLVRHQLRLLQRVGHR